MRFLLINLMLAVCATLPLPASAGVDEGIVAFDKADYVTAMREFTQAAKQGDVRAHSYLGGMYWAGLGVPKDLEAALYWNRLGAVQGDARAQYYFGLMYGVGIGISANAVEAAKWYRRSAEQGFAVTLYPIQYRLEVEISGSVDIAVAGRSQQRRANSAGVSQSSAEWGRLSL